MRVLVIGSGGREHAIIDKLSESSLVDKIYAAPGNDGMKNICELVNIKETDKESLLKFAKDNNIELTVVGPEASLATGIVDLFEANDLKIFGPTKEAAKIESSKEFAKDLMKKYNIPTASYETFTNYDKALEYINTHKIPTVIKYDGLAAGKGVVVAKTYEEANKALLDMLVDDKFGEGKVVIEEYLEGVEFSFMCFVDGTNVYPLDISQDHKRAYDNDLGPNTGGMGAYSPVPIISESDVKYALEYIMKPVSSALVKEGVSFKGLLYGGLMKTSDGIKVIEFNSRFGDPETEVVLPRLKSDLCKVMLDILDHKKPLLEWQEAYTLGIVMASKGYPMDYKKGFIIKNLDKVSSKVYYMGVKQENDNLLTNGGRVLIVVANGTSVIDAKEKALKDVEKIECDNLFYRTDIGHLSY